MAFAEKKWVLILKMNVSFDEGRCVRNYPIMGVISHALDQVGYSLAGQLDNDSILDSFA